MFVWVKQANTHHTVSQSVLFYSIPVKIKHMHVRTRRCGVHHGCVCRYREVRQEAWLQVRLDGRVHLHAVIQGFPPTGLQEREREGSRVRSTHSKCQCQSSGRGRRTELRQTWMRKSLALLSMCLLSNKAKIRDKRTAFPSAPNTQPSSP